MRTNEIHVPDGSCAGEYKIIKKYMYSYPSLKSIETDSNMIFSICYDNNGYPLTGFFEIDKEKFIRDYTNSFIHYDIDFNNKIKTTHFDSKPVYLSREWNNDGEYFYKINKYSFSDSVRLKKTLFIKSIKDNKIVFSKLGEIFNIDIAIDLKEGYIVKEFNAPNNYHLDIYKENSNGYHEIFMQFITDETPKFIYLIIQNRADNTITVMKKNKSTGIISDATEYKYEYKDYHNPILNKQIVEYNGIPISARYNDYGIMTHYNNKSTRIENIENHEAYFYPALLRRNRDFIFGEDLFYCDLFLGDNLVFTRALCVKK